MHQVTICKFLPSSHVCVLLHSILSLTSSNSITMDEMLEKVAHYMRFKNFSNLRQYLVADTKGGMYMERFIGDEIIPRTTHNGANYHRYNSASIRFKFQAGIDKRFEMH